MAETDDSSQRTERPTPLRLDEARRRGQVARSGDLTRAMVLLAGLILLGLTGKGLLDALVGMTAALLGGADGRGADLGEAVWASLRPVATSVGLLCGGVVAVGLLANFVQVGALFAPDQVRPDAGRLSPGRGLKRLVAGRSWVRGGFSLLRIAAVGLVGWLAGGSMAGRIASAWRLGPRALAGAAGEMAWTVGLWIVLAMLVLGGLDVLYQRWQHGKDLMMTRSEYLRDLRRMEGAAVTNKRRRRALRQSKRKIDDA